MEPKSKILLSALGCGCAMGLMPVQPGFGIPALIFLVLLLAQALTAVKKSETDALTGVWNLHRLESQRRRYAKCETLAVFYFDLDHLKQVNDTRGHSCGDALLREAAAALLTAAAGRGAVYRTGGDEFLIITETADPAPLHARWEQQNIAASCGWAVGSGRDLNALIRRAEQEMYAGREKKTES